MAWFKRAYRTRLNRAILVSKKLTPILEGIRDQERFIDDMADVRKILAELTQCIHEASAYNNAYAEAVAIGTEDVAINQ